MTELPDEDRSRWSNGITKLSDEDRKSVEEQLQSLQPAWHQCEVYLRDYVAGNQSAFKFLNTVGMLHGEVEEAAKEVMRVHDIPAFVDFWGNRTS
jgi:hypothetical protein